MDNDQNSQTVFAACFYHLGSITLVKADQCDKSPCAASALGPHNQQLNLFEGFDAAPASTPQRITTVQLAPGNGCGQDCEVIGDVELFATKGRLAYLRVLADSLLTHPAYPTIGLEPDLYEVRHRAQHGPVGTKDTVPVGHETGLNARRAVGAIAPCPQHTEDYANGKTPFCVVP